MTDDNRVTGPPTLLDHLGLLWRRRWFVLVPLVLVPVGAVLLSSQQTATYQASADVLLSQKNLTTSLTGVQTPYVDPARVAETEAGLARLPQVARLATKAAHVPGLTPLKLLKSSSVSATLGSDLLRFTVEHSRPDVAMRLATTYAQAYTSYRRGLDANEINNAKSAVSARLAKLEATGAKGSPLYKSLVVRERQLAALEAFQAPTAVVVQPANEAPQTGPHTARNGFLGLVLGLLLGLGCAFLIDGLDSRVHTVSALRSRLGLPLLGTLPPPPRELQETGLVMLSAPMSPDAEPYRFLRASLDVNNSELQAKTIMVTSAMDGEGKTTTAANLAVALARSGRHVVLADFDLRRPRVQQLFGLDDSRGLTDVGDGGTTLDDALQLVSFATGDGSARSKNRPGRGAGRLEVLTAGRASPDPDTLASHSTAVIIESLRERADIVLIDVAPLLPVGDAIALTSLVDAVVVVVRPHPHRSSTLKALSRIM